MTPMTLRILAAATLTVVVATDLMAQRPRRGFRRERPATTTGPAPEPEKAPENIKSYTAIVGGTVYVGTGQVLRNATVLIGDNKIVKVGPGIEVPEKATVIDAAGKCVSPGFVIVEARGMGAGNLSNDEDPADSANPFDPQIKMGLAAGITSFMQTSGFGGSSPTGGSAVHKLAYGDLKGMVLKSGTVMKMAVPLTMRQMKAFRDAVEAAKEYKKKQDAAAASGGDAGAAAGGATRTDRTGGRTGGRGERPPQGRTSRTGAPRKPKDADDLLAIMSGERKLWISCRGRFDNDRIRQALEISRTLGVGVVLEDPTTGWSIPDEIAATGSMVILNPRESVEPDPALPDSTGSNIAMARILDTVGVPVAVHPPSGRFGGASLGTGGILGQDLNTPHIDAAYAVRGGLDDRKALRTITLDAAKIMGVDDRVGSLEPGKDADVLILDGDPLHYRTFVETALVNGKVVYEKDKQPFYRHIKR